jgi:hypothetical protein
VKVGDLVKKTWGSTIKIGDIGIIVEPAGIHLGEVIGLGTDWWHVTWLTRGQSEMVKDDCLELISESR